MIRIAATQYSLLTNSLEIYLSGCKAKPHCKNCHNPELWSFDIGNPYSSDIKEDIEEKVSTYKNLINSIWILGGEPLDQPIEELEKILSDISGLGKELWLWTRYELDEIPNNIKKYCDYIKCGRYKEEEGSDDYSSLGIKLASTNQKIYKMNR